MAATAKQAHETVVEKGQSIPIYRTPVTVNGKRYDSFTFAYIQNGIRKRGRASTLENAREQAKKIARQLGEGTGHVHSLSPKEVADYFSAIRQLRQHPDLTLAGVVAEYVLAVEILGNRSVLPACEAYKRSIDKQSGFKPAMLQDVVDSFMRQLESADASTRYRQDCKSRLGMVAKVFRCQIHTITTQDLSDWLDGLKVAPRTRKNMRTALVSLFSLSAVT